MEKHTKTISRRDIHKGVHTYFDNEVLLNEDTYFKVVELMIKIITKGEKKRK